MQELEHVVAPERYDTYVLGSAVHHRRWLPEARAFLLEHTPKLAAKPVWLFSVGMPAALRSPWRLMAGLQPAALITEFVGRVSFRDHLVVSGVVRGDHLPVLGRLMMLAFTRGAGDYRDWARIDEWGDRVARVLATLPIPAEHEDVTAPTP